MKKLLLLLSTTLSLMAGMNAGININNEDLELHGEYFQFATGSSQGMVHSIDASFMQSTDETKSNLYSGGFWISNFVSGYNLKLAVGFHVKSTSRLGDDFLAVPVGVTAEYVLPMQIVNRVYITGKAEYAPETLCFNEAKSYNEFRLQGAIEPLRDIRVYGGYRKINTNYRHYEESYNSSMYVGLNFQF